MIKILDLHCVYIIKSSDKALEKNQYNLIYITNMGLYWNSTVARRCWGGWASVMHHQVFEMFICTHTYILTTHFILLFFFLFSLLSYFSLYFFFLRLIRLKSAKSVTNCTSLWAEFDCKVTVLDICLSEIASRLLFNSRGLIDTKTAIR